ncbi:MAG: NADH-quinone oxidoreductase subunit C, partial [Sulfitobacter sp.]|nr:NADH-quinone oxidoreductase subunit C [Sulfitobacter sp.]
MSEQLQELGAYIEAKRPDCVLSWEVARGELSMEVTQANITGLVDFLKGDPTCR